jgi:hypothetical protein
MVGAGRVGASVVAGRGIEVLVGMIGMLVEVVVEVVVELAVELFVDSWRKSAASKGVDDEDFVFGDTGDPSSHTYSVSQTVVVSTTVAISRACRCACAC